MKENCQFLNLPPELCDESRARYAVLPVPYEGTVCYERGTAQGPRAILEASAQVERFDEELLFDPSLAGIVTLAEVKPAATPEAQLARTFKAADAAFRSGKFVLALGGEHSITTALVEAAQASHGALSVLQIDAHADLREQYGQTRYSHASVMRRVMERCDRLCQVGIRNISQEEFECCTRQVRRRIAPADMDARGRWIDKALSQLGPKVYVTIDIDGLDPSIAPGTGTPEPGGMTWQQVLALLRRLCAVRRVVGADIVEVRPIGPNHITQFLAARLAYKIVAYTQAPAPRRRKAR
jgi:agmatinase